MDIKFFLTIKIPQHARIAIDFSKRQNQYGNYKASHTTGNTSQPSTHVLPSFRKVFCGHFHSDWKHSHTNYNLLVWGPGCCFLQDLTLGKFPMLRLRYGTTYSWVLCSWFGGGTPMFFARWRLEPIVAVVVVVVAVQVRNPRRADAVARCLRINIYIWSTLLRSRLARVFQRESSITNSPTWAWQSTKLGKRMASNDGFTRRIPKNATRDVAEYAGAKKKQWKPMCFSRCIFLQLEAQSVKKIGKKNEKNAK